MEKGGSKIHKCIEIINKVWQTLKALNAVYLITRFPKIYNKISLSKKIFFMHNRNTFDKK